jgi:hypothetical protein
MSNEIREAVQMVLTRMETHPDDFFHDEQLVLHTSPRFGWVWGVLNGDRYGLNEAEIDALKKGYDGVMYRKFHDRVLETLLYEPEQDEKMKYQVKERYALGHTDPRTLLISPSQLKEASRILTNSIYKTP